MKYVKTIIGTGLVLSVVGFSLSLEPSFGAISETPPAVGTIREELVGLSADEKAELKATRVAQRNIKGNFSSNGFDIQILRVQKIGGGVEVMIRAWQGGKQVGFGEDGSVDIERILVYNPPILVDDPNGDIIFSRPSNSATSTADVIVRSLREDPELALIQTIGQVLSVKKQIHFDSNISRGSIGRTTSTFYPDPDPESATVDGRIYTDGKGSWTLARDAASGDAAEPTAATNSLGSNEFAGTYGVQVGYFLFNTAAITDTDTISSATFSISATGGGTNADGTSFSVVETAPASNTNLVTGDFDSRVFTDLGSLSISSFGSGYNNITLNATGLTKISVTGVTKLGMTTLLDVNNTTPTGVNNLADFRFAETTGTASDPLLTVEHASAPETVSPSLNVKNGGLYIKNGSLYVK